MKVTGLICVAKGSYVPQAEVVCMAFNKLWHVNTLIQNLWYLQSCKAKLLFYNIHGVITKYFTEECYTVIAICNNYFNKVSYKDY